MRHPGIRWLILLFAFFAVFAPANQTNSENHSATQIEPGQNQNAVPNLLQQPGKIALTTLNYVAIGDSLAVGVGATAGNGYVPRYQQFLSIDNNATINLTNLAVSGFFSADLLNALQTDANMRTALQNAQVITFDIGGNDLLAARNTYKQNQTSCGGVDNQDCFRTAVANFKTKWNGIVTELFALRSDANVNVRTIDIYNPFVNVDEHSDTFPGDGGLNDFQVFKPYLDEANNHIRTTALANGIALGRVYRSFNGVDGGTDPGTAFGLIAGDLFHPNDAGHAIIAERIRSGESICLQAPNGLTSWYRGESNANDQTANGNHGTLENGTTFIAGKVGQAFDFDGTDDSVLLPTINLGSGYTIEMWIRPAGMQGDNLAQLASNDSATTGMFGSLGLFTDTPGSATNYSLKYQQGGTERIVTSSIVPANQWSHVAITRDSGDALTRVYVNGALQGVSASFSAPYDNPLSLGTLFNQQFFFYRGQMDEVSLYDRALSQSEIQTIVNADAAGKCLGTDLQISPASTSVNVGSTTTFTASGGVSPFSFNIVTPGPHHGSIDAATGVYSASNVGTDTVRVTDAAQFTAHATVTVVVPCGSGQKVWDGGGATNNWSEAANWSCDQTPTSSDTVVFDNANTKNATIDINVTVAGITIASGYTGTITVASGINVLFDGASAQADGTFNAGSGTLTFSNSGSAKPFAISGGTFSASSGPINFFGSFNQSGGTFNGGGGNVTVGQLADLHLDGGTFKAPSGTLTVTRDFYLNGATFDPNNGTVVFVGNNTSLSISPSEMIFKNLTINKTNGNSLSLFPQTDRTARVLGTLTLTEGKINGNAGSAIRAEGNVSIGTGFGDPDPNNAPAGGNGILQIQNGMGPRAITIPAGASLPNVIIDDAAITLTGSGTGEVQIASLKLMQGVINTQAIDLTVSAGSSSRFFIQDAGSFTCGGGQMRFEAVQFTLNGGSFNCSAGNMEFHNGGTVALNGGVFDAPAGPSGTMSFTVPAFNSSGNINIASGAMFHHNNGTIIFANLSGNIDINGGSGGTQDFNNITLDTVGNFAVGPGDTARVLGNLHLSHGTYTNGVTEALGNVIIDSTYTGGNGGGLLRISGAALRTVTIPVELPNIMPPIDLDAPNVLLNTSGPGPVKVHSFNLIQGVIDTGLTNIFLRPSGVFRNSTQSGGTFTCGGGQIVFDTAPFTLNGGSFNCAASNIEFRNGGTLTLNGGTFDAPAGPSGTISFTVQESNSSGNINIGPGATFNHNNGTISFGNVFDTININGASSGTRDFFNIVEHTAGRLTVASVDTVRVLGDLTVNQGGVSGNFNVLGNMTVAAGVDAEPGAITFSGTANQTFTNNGGANPTGTWTINKSGGTLILNSDLDIHDGISNFFLTNGTVTTGTNRIDIGNRFTNGSASSYIIGNLRRAFPGGGQDITRRYDVGTPTEYAPVFVRVPINQAPSSLTVSAVQGCHPAFPPATSLNYYWIISEGAGLTNTEITFLYPQTAVNGNESNYRLDRIENGQIQIVNATIFTSTNTATITGINNFAAEWTMSELPPPLVLTGPANAIVNPGDNVSFGASGGRAPYLFTLTANNSGASLQTGSTSAFYTAGSTIGATDTLRLTDSLGTVQETTITVVAPFVVINLNASGGGSLKDAIANANNTPGTQTISFNLPGSPPFTIQNSILPIINDSVIIDGTTQPGFSGSPIVELRNSGITLAASNSTIKGLVINGSATGASLGSGIYVNTVNANNNIIQGNYIGTDVSGNVAVENFNAGIRIEGGSNVIGGTTPAERNVISGNANGGIRFDRSFINTTFRSSNNVVKGNFIGVGADGVTPLGNGDQEGIFLDKADDNVIGGTQIGEGNVIAFNQIGVKLQFGSFSNSAFSARNSIRGNSIFSNNGLGIDISPVGVNQNDSCDADLTANRGQNFPELTSVVSSGGNTTIQGTLIGEKDKTFDIDFYSNESPDPSGFGEGQTYLGSTQVTTPNICDNGTPFSVTLPVALPGGRVVTATATDPNGNTSEFSHFLGLAPANIQGIVLDENNQPMQGVQIKLGLVETNTTFRVESTNSTGRFSFDNVPLGGNYKVVPDKNNFTFTPAFRTYNNLSTTQIDSYSGVADRYSIGGQVSLNGFSLSGVTLTLSGASNATTTTDSNGNYTINNLLSGTYTVTAGKPNTTFTPPSIAFPTAITSNQTANFSATSPLSVLQGRMVLGSGGSIVGMNANGSGLVTLIPKPGGDSYIGPTFSFDGSKIDFLRNNSGLFKSNSDGSDIAGPLAQTSGFFTTSWSPDGTQIAFAKDGQIFIVNADGSGTPFQVTNSGFNLQPAWSPDGTKLAFSRDDPTTVDREIFTINTNGTNLSPLTSSPSAKQRPKWSPDGSRIAFINGDSSIVIMDADGNNQTTVATTTVDGFSQDVEWSPDGLRLAFTRILNGNKKLVSALLDGSGELIILDNFDGITFDWGPDNKIPTVVQQKPSLQLPAMIQSGRVSINFANVTGSGTTTVKPISPASEGTLPGGFKPGEFAYDISTTASFTAPVTVCIKLPPEAYPTQSSFNIVSLLHNENGTLVDRTASRDFNTRTICAEVASLSEFIIAEHIDPMVPSITGLLVDQNGQPLNDFPISLSGDATRTTRTNTDGSFGFINLAQGGNYIVQPTQIGYLYSFPYESFLNMSGEQTVVFTAVQGSFSISGTALDGDGNGVSGVKISLEGATAQVTTSDGNGNYGFAGLPANGFFLMTAVKSGLSFNPSQVSIQALTENISEVNFISGPACAYGASPERQFFAMNGGSGSITVSTGSACSWTATPADNWITIVSANNGTGNGVVDFEVRENFTGSARQTTINISGQLLTIVQDGGNGCGYSISPGSQVVSAAGGNGLINLNAGETCAWEAVSSASWLTITSDRAGIGSASVSFAVAANPGPSGRAATITIGGKVFAVKQKAP